MRSDNHIADAVSQSTSEPDSLVEDKTMRLFVDGDYSIDLDRVAGLIAFDEKVGLSSARSFALSVRLVGGGFIDIDCWRGDRDERDRFRQALEDALRKRWARTRADSLLLAAIGR